MSIITQSAHEAFFSHETLSDCYNSILRIASIVGKITIRVERRNSPKLPISFIHDVLNCECKELCIMNWDATYSLQEMFELVQVSKNMLNFRDRKRKFNFRFFIRSTRRYISLRRSRMHRKETISLDYIPYVVEDPTSISFMWMLDVFFTVTIVVHQKTCMKVNSLNTMKSINYKLNCGNRCVWVCIKPNTTSS